MIAAEGILTARGGVSSHAALVARQMGKVCVCGAAALQIDYDTKTVTVDGQTFKEGDFLSIDGTAGDSLRRRNQDRAVAKSSQGLLDGDKAAQADREVQELRAAHEVVRARPRACQVRTNADNPEQTAQRRRVRRDGHRPHAAPSTCSSKATASTRCAR